MAAAARLWLWPEEGVGVDADIARLASQLLYYFIKQLRRKLRRLLLVASRICGWFHQNHQI
jgi:hypothetical protein